ncbi:Uncharacterised protein [Mycobacteroides abscessus]|nr:Uncharacterised protein [Mycobacteroides abscessus]
MRTHLVEEAPVDLVDDFQVPGQGLGEQSQRPGLQRLGQQGVVGVAEGGDGDLPGLVPAQSALVDQQPHQLRDTNGRMSVVELQSELLGQLVDRALGHIFQDVQHPLQRARYKEVLLQQPQALTGLGLVVGVEHLGDGFGRHLVLDGLVVVARVEGVQLEGLHGPRAPQRQRVTGVHSVALDRGVVGDALEEALRNPASPEVPVLVEILLGVAAPSDNEIEVGFGYFPRVSVVEPVVGLLDLPSVADLLVEDPVLIADAVTDRRAIQGGQRVQVARCQASEPTVAQPRLLLAGEYLVDVLTQRGQGVASLLFDLQVQQVVAQLGTHQELGRQVHRHLAAQVQIGLHAGDPALLHAIPDRQGQRAVVVRGCQHARRAPNRVPQMVDDGSLQSVGIQTGAGMLVVLGLGGVRHEYHRAIEWQTGKPETGDRQVTGE